MFQTPMFTVYVTRFRVSATSCDCPASWSSTRFCCTRWWWRCSRRWLVRLAASSPAASSAPSRSRTLVTSYPVTGAWWTGSIVSCWWARSCTSGSPRLSGLLVDVSHLGYKEGFFRLNLVIMMTFLYFYWDFCAWIPLFFVPMFLMVYVYCMINAPNFLGLDATKIVSIL